MEFKQLRSFACSSAYPFSVHPQYSHAAKKGRKATYSAKEVVARVLAVELTSAVQAEVAANTVGIGRGALAS